MTDTEQRIKFMQEFAEHKAKERRARIRRQVALALENKNRGDTMLWDQLCWGAVVVLPVNATQEQMDAKADLINALLEASQGTL